MTHYEVLGVPTNADPETIKKAYWRLAKLHHPDAGGNPQTFSEISAAYDTLSDPIRRREYDCRLPRPKPGKPIKSNKPPKGLTAEQRVNWRMANDPNLGRHTIKDAPTPKYDIWGQPVKPEGKWVDSFAGQYESQISPELR